MAINARSVPFGAVERASCINQMLAMIRRFGPPSVFLTIAPDDVHNPLSIRLQVETDSNNNFPASATDFLEVLKNEPERFKREHLRTDCEASALEDVLQRGAAQHPASTSLLFDRISKTVLEVLCGTPPTTLHHTLAKHFHCRPEPRGFLALASGHLRSLSSRDAAHTTCTYWRGVVQCRACARGLHCTPQRSRR